MNPKFQRRVQRYGWDLAAAGYESLWQQPLSTPRAGVVSAAELAPGECVLDVACGTGLVTFEAATVVGDSGRVTGIDISGNMVAAARRRAADLGVRNVTFARLDAEKLEFADASFDVVLCALGLMYTGDPSAALAEMIRVLRPGGRIVVAVWGERSRCGWSPVFEIVAAEVASEVCPMFFQLGQEQLLTNLLRTHGLAAVRQERIQVMLGFRNGEEACDAALIGGPVALAWSRFSDEVRQRVRDRYKSAIAPFRDGTQYLIPGEFVIASAVKPPD